jgi:hypothetical protein
MFYLEINCHDKFSLQNCLDAKHAKLKVDELKVSLDDNTCKLIHKKLSLQKLPWWHKIPYMALNTMWTSVVQVWMNFGVGDTSMPTWYPWTGLVQVKILHKGAFSLPYSIIFVVIEWKYTLNSVISTPIMLLTLQYPETLGNGCS